MIRHRVNMCHWSIVYLSFNCVGLSLEGFEEFAYRRRWASNEEPLVVDMADSVSGKVEPPKGQVFLMCTVLYQERTFSLSLSSILRAIQISNIYDYQPYFLSHLRMRGIWTSSQECYCLTILTRLSNSISCQANSCYIILASTDSLQTPNEWIDARLGCLQRNETTST